MFDSRKYLIAQEELIWIKSLSSDALLEVGLMRKGMQFVNINLDIFLVHYWVLYLFII